VAWRPEDLLTAVFCLHFISIQKFQVLCANSPLKSVAVFVDERKGPRGLIRCLVLPGLVLFDEVLSGLVLSDDQVLGCLVLSKLVLGGLVLMR